MSVTDSVQVDTLPLRAYTLAATTDPAYRPNDPRFTPRYPGPTFRVRPGDLVQICVSAPAGEDPRRHTVALGLSLGAAA